MIPYFQYVFRAEVKQATVYLYGDDKGKSIEGVAGWLDLWISGMPGSPGDLKPLRDAIEAGGGVEAASIEARLALYGPGVPGADTGKLDLQAWSSGTIRAVGKEWSIEVEFPDARLLYQSLVDERDYEEWDRDVFVTRPDIFRGSFTGTIRQSDSGEQYPVLELHEPHLELTAPDNELAAPDNELAAPDNELAAPDNELAALDNELAAQDNRVTSIALFIEQAMKVVFDRTKIDRAKNPCPDGGASPRKLAIQLVFFENTQDVRNIAADQVEAAQEVWKPACITIDHKMVAPVTLDALTNGEANDAETFASKHSSHNLAIPVFLVRNDLVPNGGGVCFNPGTALAKVVISTNVSRTSNSGVTETNRWLLAHELGHVFSGFHPEGPLPLFNWDRGVVPVTLWRGEPNTVLKPSRFAANPVESSNSVSNCWAAWFSLNPALTAV